MVIAQNGKYVANMMVNETEMPDISIGMISTVTVSALPECNTISGSEQYITHSFNHLVL